MHAPAGPANAINRGELHVSKPIVEYLKGRRPARACLRGETAQHAESAGSEKGRYREQVGHPVATVLQDIDEGSLAR